MYVKELGRPLPDTPSFSLQFTELTNLVLQGCGGLEVLNVRHLTVSALLFTCLAVLAQEKKDPPVDPKDKKEPAPATGEVDFAWKWEKDKPIFSQMTTKTVQNIKVQELNINQIQEQTFFFKWTPLKEDAGKWTVKQTIEGIKMKIDIAGNPVSYDSTVDQQAAGSNTALNDFFKNLKGSEFTVTVTKEGTVEKIEGREAFVAKLTAANKQLEGLLQKILSEEAFKQMSDPSFSLLPKDSPKKKAKDKWERTTSLDLGPVGGYDIKYTYELDKVTGDIAEVKVTPSVTYKAPKATETGDALPFKIKGADLKSDATAGGTIKFNTKTGRIESSNVTLKINGKVTLEIGGQTSDVEIRQEQTTDVAYSDKSSLPEPKK